MPWPIFFWLSNEIPLETLQAHVCCVMDPEQVPKVGEGQSPTETGGFGGEW